MSSEEALLKKYRIEIEDLRSRLEKNSQIENNVRMKQLLCN